MKLIKRIATTIGFGALCALTFAGTANADATAGDTDGSLIQLSKVEGEGYRIEASDVTVKAGSEGTIEITIKAKKGFKVNKDYPHKVKFDAAPDGLELVSKKLKKKDGAFEGKQAFRFKGKVRALTAGKKTVTGVVKTSVCNESQCLIKKEKIAFTVDAS
jgi:hypothetical protein